MENDFYISPNYKVSDWVKSLKSSNWENMLSIFQDRLDGRFLKAIDLIQSDETDIGKFSGFSIMALDCLIIETLQQFYVGIDETPTRKHRESFQKFFQRSSNLKDFGTPPMDEIFYSHFRCGLLHQAQTKKKSKIKRNLGVLYKIEGSINDGLIIDRDIFHSYLLSDIQNYIEALRSGTDDALRNNFIKKMNSICQVHNAD